MRKKPCPFPDHQAAPQNLASLPTGPHSSGHRPGMVRNFLNFKQLTSLGRLPVLSERNHHTTCRKPHTLCHMLAVYKLNPSKTTPGTQGLLSSLIHVRKLGLNTHLNQRNCPINQNALQSKGDKVTETMGQANS